MRPKPSPTPSVHALRLHHCEAPWARTKAMATCRPHSPMRPHQALANAVAPRHAASALARRTATACPSQRAPVLVVRAAPPCRGRCSQCKSRPRVAGGFAGGLSLGRSWRQCRTRSLSRQLLWPAFSVPSRSLRPRLSLLGGAHIAVRVLKWGAEDDDHAPL